MNHLINLKTSSIQKAKHLLNYNPSHDFKQGLKESLTWYYNNLK